MAICSNHSVLSSTAFLAIFSDFVLAWNVTECLAKFKMRVYISSGFFSRVDHGREWKKACSFHR